MSFILDALKKSETERQQQAGAEFSDVPSKPRESHAFRWLWILGLLLLVNVVILMGILLRDPVEQPPAAASQPAETSFEEKIADARQNQPVPESVAPAEAPTAVEQAPVRVIPSTPANRGRVLTIDEVRLNGTLQVAALHLDIHVFSDDPAERFVFINMAKHRENSRLDEGPAVVEITPEGVILEHQGTTFLLPRE